MACFSSGRPPAGVYLWILGSAAARCAASTMYSGVGKSGSPAPNPMTGRPAAFSALAFASTARVADSEMAEMRAEMLVVGMLPWWHLARGTIANGSELRGARGVQGGVPPGRSWFAMTRSLCFRRVA